MPVIVPRSNQNVYLFIKQRYIKQKVSITIVVMSALWYESLDMNMTYFLPILCILYVLLPRKTRTLPVTNSLKDKEDIHIRFNKPSSDNINGISDMLESHLTKETGIALVDDYTDDSRDHVLSSSGLNPKDHNKKMKNVDSVVPEYMMDLYKRLSRKNLGLSNSNIVRSFRNIDSKGNFFITLINIFCLFDKLKLEGTNIYF